MILSSAGSLELVTSRTGAAKVRRDFRRSTPGRNHVIAILKQRRPALAFYPANWKLA